MAKLKDETKVITNEVRFSYANVFVPTAFEGQEPKYNVALLIDKDDEETIDCINQAIANATTASLSKWGGKIPKKFKNPLRDGDEEYPDDPTMANKYFMNCSSKSKPEIIEKYKRDGKVVPITSADDFYSGCYGRASINFFGYSTAGNNGIGVGLNNLQKTNDGIKLSGKAAASTDFEDSEDEDDADL